MAVTMLMVLTTFRGSLLPGLVQAQATGTLQ